MKKIIVCMVYMLSCATLFSQTFSKGYILKPDGAKVSGYLKRNTNAELVQSLQFSDNGDGNNAIQYTPLQLKGFGFDEGETFEALRFTDPLDSTVKTGFVRLLLEGFYNVYSLAKASTADYLIKSADTTYRIYDDMVSEMGFKVQLGNYRNTFLFLARDCNKLHIQFENVMFREDEIVNLVKRINACHESTSVVHHQKTKYKTAIVVHAGGSAIKDKFSQEVAGAELRFSNPKVNRKLFYVIGLHYSKTEKLSFTQIYYPVQRKKNTGITEVYSLPVTVQYALTEHMVQPYGYVGFSAAYRRTNIRQRLFSEGFQGTYGVAVVGGVGVEVYPVRFFAIKVDWRYELHLNYPALGVAFRF